jgi:hypothetical protein
VTGVQTCALPISDNDFTDRAYADGVVIDAKEIVIEHMHPAFGLAEVDATYARSNDPAIYAAGLETYNRLKP